MNRRNFIKTGLIFVPSVAVGQVLVPRRRPIAAAAGGGLKSASDSFDRANAGTLGANWTKLSGFSDVGITSNAAKGSTVGDNADAYTALGTFTANQYSEVIVGSASNDGGPTVRSDTANNFYVLDLSGSAATVYKCVGGSFTNINSVSVTVATNDVWRLTISSTTITTTQNGVTRNNFTDSTFAGAGYPGIFCSADVITFLSWAASEI